VIWLVVGLLVGGLVVLLIRGDWQSDEEQIDPETATRAAIELHRIHRRIDVVMTKQEQRQAATQARREIAEALDNEEPHD
jgi:GAF domain-containing protein